MWECIVRYQWVVTSVFKFEHVHNPYKGILTTSFTSTPSGGWGFLGTWDDSYTSHSKLGYGFKLEYK